MKAPFRAQDVEFFRPYPDEIPWELLRLAETDEETVVGYADADFIRVAKYRNEPVGVYVIRPETATRFELCNLAVDPNFRHKGIGRWLLGHAIGIAETKGGREIFVKKAPLRGLFERTGFVQNGPDLLLVLTPE